jgi:hypothetical protein
MCESGRHEAGAATPGVVVAGELPRLLIVILFVTAARQRPKCSLTVVDRNEYWISVEVLVICCEL